MNGPGGCVLEPLDASACADLLAWVQGQRPASDADRRLAWLVAHCDDGVTWGSRSDGAAWRLAASVFPRISPPVSVETLQELRLFGEDEEILIWRAGSGLRGRRLRDTPRSGDDVLRPKDEWRLLLGDRLIETAQGFSRVGSASGAEQAVPFALDEKTFGHAGWPLRLLVRHYFQEDPATGAVRVAVTRLVHVRVEPGGAR